MISVLDMVFLLHLSTAAPAAFMTKEGQAFVRDTPKGRNAVEEQSFYREGRIPDRMQE
jgi:hypothetical protein